MAFGVQIVEEGAIVVGVSTFVGGRVVEVTGFEAMLNVDGALGGFEGLQKVFDGSTVLDIFASFGQVFVFILAALHDLLATSNIIIIPPLVKLTLLIQSTHSPP